MEKVFTLVAHYYDGTTEVFGFYRTEEAALACAEKHLTSKTFAGEIANFTVNVAYTRAGSTHWMG